jgi:hypothetical protein
MNTYKETIKMNGGVSKIASFFAWLFSVKVAGYRFYVTERVNLTKNEIAQLKRIPIFVPDKIAEWIGERMIGRYVRMYRTHNIVPTISRTAMAAALAGVFSNIAEIEINYQELGTGTNPPANSDTALQTPSAGTRKVVSSISQSLNIISITSFWAATEATGTWREFSLFINGTATSNSGTLFNRVAMNITVSSTEAMTLDGEMVIN